MLQQKKLQSDLSHLRLKIISLTTFKVFFLVNRQAQGRLSSLLQGRALSWNKVVKPYYDKDAIQPRQKKSRAGLASNYNCSARRFPLVNPILELLFLLNHDDEQTTKLLLLLLLPQFKS